ncbi:metacaspase-2-like [Nymphalis io]|uniref:metacaspase-2-like n=1 Tax=Inachis io TaxID=171585 RepID=UPI0021697667|nr:metacaspase-2-like [Nymphalis io]
MNLKNKDKLNNVSSTYTDAYLLYINKDKDQDNADEIKESLTFTNITMKDENNTTKPATIQYDIIKNKSNITSVTLLYNNERKTIENLKTTLNKTIFQNSKIHETNNNISYITNKINNDTTETKILLSYKAKKTTLKAFKGNMSNNADTKKFINKISKSTVYSEQTNPLSTSSVKNTTRLKHCDNVNGNTTKVPSIYTNKIFTSDMLNDTDFNNVIYKHSTKSDLYLEDSQPLRISSFKNTKQLKRIINKKGITTNISVTYTTMPLNIKNKKEDKIILQKSSIFTNFTTKNEANINNNYARKPIKFDIEKNKISIDFYENDRKKINNVTQKVTIFQKKQVTVKNIKINLNTASHQQTNDNIFYNTNKTYDSKTEITMPSSYTTNRTTFIPSKVNMSNNTDNNVIDTFNNKSTVNLEETPLPTLFLKDTTQLKLSANNKRYTTKIPLTYTKMTTTSKTFEANMPNDSEIKNLMYKFNTKDMVYSEAQLSLLPISYLKNTTLLKENVYDKEYAPKIPLQYTKRSTTFEAFKGYMTNYNDIKNLMFKLSNESAVYSEKGPPLTPSFNYTNQWQQNTKSIKNGDKKHVTHTTILNIIKNKNQNKESKIKIKKSLKNISLEDENNTNISTAKKLQKKYHDIVHNKNNIEFYDTKKDKISNLTIQKGKLYQEDNTTISNIPLSHMYKFDNKSIVYSEGVRSLPTPTLKYTKHLKEIANTKDNTLTIPSTYTSTSFNANISNNIDNKNFTYNFNNKNTIYFEEIPHQTTILKHSNILTQIDNSKINTPYKNVTLTKSLPVKPLMDKINITNKNYSQMITKVEQKTSKFNYINNLYYKDNLINSVTKELKVSHTYETLHTQIYTRSTLKVLKKAKTIKYNTYKPTEEDTEFKIKPLTVPSNKISQKQLQLHYLLSTKSMGDNMKTKKISMKTNVSKKIDLFKSKTTKSPHSIIRHEVETKNAKRMNSLDESLLDRFRKPNLYPAVKKPSIKRRKVMKRLRLSNKEKDIPTINTNDIFSLRKNAHLLQKSPQSLYKDLISNPATAIPKQYIIHPKFSKIDAAIKLRQEYMRPKPLFLAYDKDFYRDDYQTHHHSKALSLREKVNHIRDSLRKPSSDVQEQAVIERPTYLSKNSKPKFLRDRIYSIRNYLHNNDFVRSTQFPIKHYLEETSTTYSPYIDPLYYFRRSGWYEVRTSTQDPTTVRPTRRKRRTIYFLSPTVPYYRYF